MNIELSCPAPWISADYDSVPTRRSLLSRLRSLEDDISWRAFFDTYWRLIYNVARKSGLRDAEAQDIVQETVIAVARRLPEFRYDPSKGSFKRWLLLITRRRVQDHLRKRYRGLPDDGADPRESRFRCESVPDPLLLPDEQLEAAGEAEWRGILLQMALVRVRERAHPKHYQAFDFCVLQNIPAGQVARMLGLSRAQVYLAKHRLTLTLRRTAARLEVELNRGAGI
jgi:RNA polymerase sigma factor (sigma-70 family)